MGFDKAQHPSKSRCAYPFSVLYSFCAAASHNRRRKGGTTHMVISHEKSLELAIEIARIVAETLGRTKTAEETREYILETAKAIQDYSITD
jgi:hypothetical protein